MSVRYNEDFKKEVVKAYMAGDRSISQLSVDFNIAKSTIRTGQKNTVMNVNIPRIKKKVILLLK